MNTHALFISSNLHFLQQKAEKAYKNVELPFEHRQNCILYINCSQSAREDTSQTDPVTRKESSSSCAQPRRGNMYALQHSAHSIPPPIWMANISNLNLSVEICINSSIIWLIKCLWCHQYTFFEFCKWKRLFPTNNISFWRTQIFFFKYIRRWHSFLPVHLEIDLLYLKLVSLLPLSRFWNQDIYMCVCDILFSVKTVPNFF